MTREDGSEVEAWTYTLAWITWRRRARPAGRGGAGVVLVDPAIELNVGEIVGIGGEGV